MRELLVILILCATTGCVLGYLRSDLNNDNIVDSKDIAIMSSEWLAREPDFLGKIKMFEGRHDLTMKEKQMLHEARKKYIIYIQNGKDIVYGN